MDSRYSKILNFVKEKALKIKGGFDYLFGKINYNLGVNRWLGKKQIEFDKKLVYSLSGKKIPNLSQMKYIGRFLSNTEKAILKISIFLVCVSVVFLGGRFFVSHIHVAPKDGGTYTEALVGIPKYINPLYASYSDIDSDISILVFSSILKRDKNGQLVNDLADNYQVSEDGRVYTFKIKEGVKWHNGQNLTVEDIIFTLNAIKDSRFKSPLRPSFIGVDIEKIDDRTIKFILAEPYAAFLDLLTFGIIPEQLWYQISPASAGLAELNLKPVGSGPYKFKSFIKDKSGHIRSYSLIKNEDYYGEKPYIENIVFRIFVSFEEAVSSLNNGSVNGVSYLPRNVESNLIAKESLNIHRINLPQLMTIFLNNSKNKALESKKVRQALAMAINKNSIVDEVFGGSVRMVDGPILPDSFAYNAENKKYKFNKDGAGSFLEEEGWKLYEITKDMIAQAETDINSEDEKVRANAEKTLDMGEGAWGKKDSFFIIEITAVDSEDSDIILNEIKKYWEAIGVKVIVNLVPASRIQADIINPKKFEALFYGQMVGIDPDSYAFWHSSQIDNGLNIAGYADKAVDKLLEDARLSNNLEERREKYIKFQEIITEDLPAIFMYSPVYVYVQDKTVKGFEVNNVLSPDDRFSNITNWYIKTKKELSF